MYSFSIQIDIKYPIIYTTIFSSKGPGHFYFDCIDICIIVLVRGFILKQPEDIEVERIRCPILARYFIFHFHV